MSQRRLVRPDEAYKQSYREYIDELGAEVRYPFPLDFDHADFPALLTRLDEFEQGINIPPGFVPSSTYWLVQGNRLLGVSNLRHVLNDRIREAGGHIGLGIRPSCRGQGLGRELLALTMEQAKVRGISVLHIHCYKNNTASARMIMANGGLLDSEIDDNGQWVQRYLIALDN